MRYLAARSTPQSRHCTQRRSRFRYYYSIPVTPRSYTASDNPPGVCQVRHNILTILRTFMRSPTRFKRSMRTSNNLCTISDRRNATRLSFEWKYASISYTVLSSPFSSASIGATNLTQCLMTVSTTTLNIVGGRGYPWATPRYPSTAIYVYHNKRELN